MNCECSNKKRSVKITPVECEQNQPPVSKTTVEPMAETKSMGSQYCCREDSTIKTSPGLEVLGPTGRVCQIEPRGYDCQAGRIPEHEPKPMTITKPAPKLELEPESNKYQSYQHKDEKQVVIQRSNMTQTHSEIRIKRNKQLVQTEPKCEYAVEDAARYYPEFTNDSYPSLPVLKDSSCSVDIPINVPEKIYQKSDNSYQKKNNKVQSEGPSGSPEFGAPSPPLTPQDPQQPGDEVLSIGLKNAVTSRGTGPKGLCGIFCFDQKRIFSRKKHSK